MGEWWSLPQAPRVSQGHTGFYQVTGESTPEAYSVRLVNGGRLFASVARAEPGIQIVNVIIRDDVAPRTGWIVQEWRTPPVLTDPRNRKNSFWDTDWQMEWGPHDPWYSLGEEWGDDDWDE